MILILDVAVIAIVVTFSIRGFKSGLVRTVIELFGWIAVVLAASFLANTVSGCIYDAFICDSVKNELEQSIVNSGQQGINEFFGNLPGSLQNVLNAYKFNAQTVDIKGTASEMSSAIVTQIRQPIVSVLSFFLTIILFVLGIILVRILANICHSIVSRIPIVSGLNRVFGLLTGSLKGTVISLLVVWILSFMILFAGNYIGIEYEDIAHTYLFNMLNKINPLIKFV